MTPPDPVDRAASRGKKALCVLAALLLAGLAGESALRVRQRWLYGTWAVPGWLRMGGSPTSVWHPFLRSVPRPAARWVEIEKGNRAVVETGPLGFRSDSISVEKPGGTLRIACVGGSVVYDTRVGTAQSWPMQLRAKLRERFPGRAIEVVNAGVPARTSADSLVNVALRLLPLDPDVVIVLHGVNDQKPNRYPGFKPDYSHWYMEPPSPYLRPLHSLLDRSLLASHVRYRLRFIVNPRLRENWRGEHLTRYDEVTRPGLETYRRNLESIIGMCRIRGIEVVIATAGHSLDENADWTAGSGTRNPLVYYHETLTLEGIRHAFREYNRVNREVAAEHGCPLVDLERLVPEGRQYFQDDVHFTPWGSETAASLFIEHVPWERWLAPPGPVSPVPVDD